MHRSRRVLASRLLTAGACACLAATSLAQVSVRSVKVLGSKDTVEIEVEASDRLVPQTRVLTGPDRLVVDFPNAVPSSQVTNQSIDRGDVKDVRVGLFQSKPPVTRVVLDLKSARSFQVFPYGRTVMIKVTGNNSGVVEARADNLRQPVRSPGLVSASYTASAEPVATAAPAQPALNVTYADGMLGIHSNKATLSEVLYAIQQRTGAEISIPAGAEQERVVAEVEPAPAAEVIAKLLNGSRFNFLILNSVNDPRQLDRVILTMRTDGGITPLPPQQANDDIAGDTQPVPAPQPNNAAVRPAPETPTEDRQEADSNEQQNQ